MRLSFSREAPLFKDINRTEKSYNDLMEAALDVLRDAAEEGVIKPGDFSRFDDKVEDLAYVINDLEPAVKELIDFLNMATSA